MHTLIHLLALHTPCMLERITACAGVVEDTWELNMKDVPIMLRPVCDSDFIFIAADLCVFV